MREANVKPKRALILVVGVSRKEYKCGHELTVACSCLHP